MNVRGMGYNFGGGFGGKISTSKEALANLVQEKLEELGYFPTYITPDLKRKIRDLQEDELELRKSKTFTLEKGVDMLRDIDTINAELTKLYRESKEEVAMATRKRKCVKPKQKRKVIKKTTTRKK
jgi:hypothetical protein